MTRPLKIPRKDYLLREKVEQNRGQAEIENYLAIELWSKQGFGGGTSAAFDFPGPLVIAIWDLFLSPVTKTYNQVIFGITASLTSAATIEMDVNFTPAATFTIPTSVNINSQVLAPQVTVPALTALQFRIISPGAGGAGLTIFPIEST